MTDVTVCVPAFEGAPWIQEALRSIQAQTHTAFLVDVAVDPSPAGDADGTVAAVEPFLADPRFVLRRNATRLGWDGNLRAQLERVVTPYVVIVPQDDVLEPDYLEVLLGVLAERPEAGVAYVDLVYFGAFEGRKVLDLPARGDRDEQLLEWFLADGAMPWRSVTRTAVMRAAGGFPVDGFRGFLVECEYALSLLLEARAIRVPRPLFRKRLHPPEVMTASRRRIAEATPEEQRRAFERHRNRMLSLLRDARPRPPDVLRLAAEAHILRCWVYSGGALRALEPSDRQLVRRLLGEVDRLLPVVPAARRIRSILLEVLGWHELALGRETEALAHARAAVAEDDRNELAAHLRGTLLRTGSGWRSAWLSVAGATVARWRPRSPAPRARRAAGVRAGRPPRQG
jgi:hypothetical protein